ncbi:unnamed protein product [Callosobruchus maculatus]|uniref:FK506-binding protein n=1 Tax=Callosobruchus maculatus TaxID=64391 RepID=A0A653BTW5_CALMS|nr:unnamed protein product [Callosobruchus maculatus]
MFWGLIMEPQRRYTQTVKKPFHISMAALDYSTSSDEPAQVMCGYDGRNYLLCTLRKPDVMQCPLDLNFEVGDELSFATNGECHVHLTGYLNDELPGEFDEGLPEEEEEDEEITFKEKKKNKRIKKDGEENAPPRKKAKKAKITQDEDSDENEEAESDEDESDESDLNTKALLEKSFADSEDDTSFAAEEESGEEEEESDDEDEEDMEEEADGSDEEADSDEEDVTNVSSSSNSKKNKMMNGGPRTPDMAKNEKKQKEKNSVETKSPTKETQSPKKRSLQGGVIVEDIREGQGPPAKNGKFVSVYYEGRLKQNNKVFDATTKGAGFQFRLGSGEVIKGWDVGVAGMKVGGKRRIICPPQMAYGVKGSPPAIPPNSTLVFEVELKKVK